MIVYIVVYNGLFFLCFICRIKFSFYNNNNNNNNNIYSHCNNVARKEKNKLCEINCKIGQTINQLIKSTHP